MSSAAERIYSAAGALALAAIASSAGLLDDLTSRTGLSATVLLLITLAVIIGIALTAVGVMSMQEVSDTEDYRTACRSTMNRDIKKARRQVPHATQPRNLISSSGTKDYLTHPTERRYKVVDRAEFFQQTAEAVRAAGIKAADQEFDHGVTSINPHQQPSRWHVLWMTSKEARLMERQALRAASADAVHTNTQRV
jgi:hypothetical protein